MSCLILSPNSAAVMPILGDYHFFIDGTIYVVSRGGCPDLPFRTPQPASGLPLAPLNRPVTDVDAVEHGQSTLLMNIELHTQVFYPDPEWVPNL